MFTDDRYYGNYKVTTDKDMDADEKLKFIKNSVEELVDETRFFLRRNEEIQVDFSTMKIIIKEQSMMDGPFCCDEDGIPQSWALTVGLRFEKKEEAET